MENNEEVNVPAENVIEEAVKNAPVETKVVELIGYGGAREQFFHVVAMSKEFLDQEAIVLIDSAGNRFVRKEWTGVNIINSKR